MNKFSEFAAETVDRLVKTFIQFYLGFWILTADIIDTTVGSETANAFDTLFTVDNLKAGVVGMAFSLATSYLTKPFGRKKDTPTVL